MTASTVSSSPQETSTCLRTGSSGSALSTSRSSTGCAAQGSRRHRPSLPNTSSRSGAALATKQNAPLVEDRTLTAELLDISLNSSAARLSLAVAADVPISEDSPPRLTWLSRTHEALGSLTADTTRLDGEGRTVVDVTVPFAELDEQRDGTCDVYVDVASNRSITRTRVKSPALEAPARARTVRFYRTAHGNLSMALHAPRTGAS